MLRFTVLVSLYVTIFTVFSTLFLTLLHSPLLETQDVLFYRGVSLLLLTFLITGIGIVCAHAWLCPINAESGTAALIASTCIHMALFVVFPVTFDRSVTMFLLRTLEQNRSPENVCTFTPENLEAAFIERYVHEEGAIERRLHEQSLINMISVDDQCIRLLDQGRFFLSFSNVVSKLYNLVPR